MLGRLNGEAPESSASVLLPYRGSLVSAIPAPRTILISDFSAAGGFAAENCCRMKSEGIVTFFGSLLATGDSSLTSTAWKMGRSSGSGKPRLTETPDTFTPSGGMTRLPASSGSPSWISRYLGGAPWSASAAFSMAPPPISPLEGRLEREKPGSKSPYLS